MSDPTIHDASMPPTSLGPFLESVGAEQVSSSNGRATWKLVVRDSHLRTHGILHGGMAAVMLDTAMGRAVTTLCAAEQSAVTAQLNVNFVRPARSGDELLATGEVLHCGRQTAVTRGELRTADGTLIATASGTFLFVQTPAAGESLLSSNPSPRP